MSFKTYSFMILIIANTSAFVSLSQHISKLTDLAAVTHFAEVDVYYRTVKVQKVGKPPRESKRPAKRVRVKKTLCYNIFSSQFFAMKDEEPLNVDDLRTRIDLGNYHPEIFDSIFVSRQDALSYWTLGDGEYVNNYERRPVHLEGISMTALNEFVFTCPVWVHDLQTVKQYFVSEEYNVNSVASHPIAGRFVFLPDPDLGHLKIIALAEESAVGSVFINKKVAELYYAKRRKRDGRTETRGLDPVCRLSPANKLRLCASIFASEFMKDRYLFFPSQDNLVHKDCRRRQISFIANEPASMRYIRKLIRGSLEKNRIYDEWVIGCKVFSTRRTNGGGRITSVYYVSRGDMKNTVFGYTNKLQDKRVFVDSYFNNVSVVARVDRDLEYEYEEVYSETASETSTSYASARISWSDSSPGSTKP